MIKKVLAVLTIAYMVVISILPFALNYGTVDDEAVRCVIDNNVIYLDSEAIALSSASNTDSSLREKAIEAGNLINDMREDAGLDPLDWDLNLEQTSDVRSQEISDVFSHTRPSGKPWNTVNSQIQGGENLAFGFDEAQDVVDAWEDSPTHYDNMMYGDFTKGAISIYKGDDDTYYWAEEFGY